MKAPQMDQRRLIDHFSQWQAEFEYLNRNNTDFQEICEDFNTASKTLAELRQSSEADINLIDDCQDLLDELRLEALQMLQQHFPYLVASEKEGG